MLLCILTGNIDLSVGSVVALLGAISTVMIVNLNWPVWVVIPASLFVIISMLKRRQDRVKYQFEVGFIWVDVVKICVFIVIIGFVSITLARYYGIPTVMMILALIIASYTFVTRRTIAGRHVYALGGNEKAAML